MLSRRLVLQSCAVRAIYRGVVDDIAESVGLHVVTVMSFGNGAAMDVQNA